MAPGACDVLHRTGGNSMTYWGVAIPGLAMRATELPCIPGLLRLDNPEAGDGVQLQKPYSLYDVAEIHSHTINRLGRQLSTPFQIIGMSMGGMITSILATTLRSQFPKNCHFRFLVTSANTPQTPAVPMSRLEEWRTATPGVVADFERILRPFFSEEYLRQHPEALKEYAKYRATGQNGQSPKAFMRQLSALQSFNGEFHFSNLQHSECTIIGGADDAILGPKHCQIIKQLSPSTPHMSVPGLGHMINIEMPAAFESKFSGTPN